MREVKFRAWNQHSKKMVLGPTDDSPSPSWVLAMCSANNLEPMQYTGLQDRNGQDIYEGDVLSTILTKDDVMNNVIVYGHCGFEHKWLDAGTAHLRSSKQDPMFRNVSLIFDIIGNIYENKELIE